MSFYSQEALISLGFRRLGNNVLISERASIYNPEQIEIGDNSRIDDFCVVSGNVIIRKNVHLAVFCNLAGGERGIVMEDFSGLAYGCQVFTQSDDYSGRSLTNPTVPDLYKKETKGAIYIGRHCIIGASSVVFPGVSLAEGAAIGAMSMVTRDAEPWSIYFGIPAKKISQRSRDILELEQQYLKTQGQRL